MEGGAGLGEKLFKDGSDCHHHCHYYLNTHRWRACCVPGSVGLACHLILNTRGWGLLHHSTHMEELTCESWRTQVPGYLTLAPELLMPWRGCRVERQWLAWEWRRWNR